MPVIFVRVIVCDMEDSFDRLETLLYRERIFLRPDFNISVLCMNAGADEESFDKYLLENFGITLRKMIKIYIDAYFNNIL